MKQAYLSKSEKETKEIGYEFAKELLKKKKGCVVVGLKGDLGGGKTTFAQGFAEGLGVKDKILSPTFVIMKRFGNFYHIDCYRAKDEKDLLELGFEEIISDPKNIVLVEWPEKIEKIMPENSIYVSFEFLKENKRKIIIR